MPALSRLVPVLALVIAALVGGGCTTTMKPTRPSAKLEAEGPPLAGLRFDGEETRIREPGLPVSPNRFWQREVANYTASSLATLLSSPESAPPASTTVGFDLAGPSPLQIGPWKSITITMTSTLPDGSVVRSQPVEGNLDDVGEYALVTGLGVGGTVLDITSVIASLFFFTNPGLETGAIFFGALLGGLALNVAQSGAQYVVAASEETRWSDLYAQALRQHAKDIRAGVGTGPPPGMVPASTAPASPTKPRGDAPPGADPSDDPSADPSDVAPPPPLAPSAPPARAPTPIPTATPTPTPTP
jgi:hypothetical protein